MKKIILLAAALFICSSSFATQYVIMFGENLGFNYSPKDLSVNVGDTIFWQGDFSTHPLVSVSVPEGSETFSNGTGTMYMYVVMVQGTYDYECQVHFSQGMTGRFIAANIATTTLAVNYKATPFYLVQENGLNVLYSNFNGAVASDVILNIYDESGRRVIGTTINAYNSRYVLPQLLTGIYIVRVADNESLLFAGKIWQP